MGCSRRGTRGAWASRGLATRARRLLDSARHLLLLLHLLPLKRGLRNRGTQKIAGCGRRRADYGTEGDRHSKMLCACVFGEPEGRRRGGREQRETGNGGLGIRGSGGYLLQWLAHPLQPSTSSPWYVPRPGPPGVEMALWSQSPGCQWRTRVLQQQGKRVAPRQGAACPNQARRQPSPLLSLPFSKSNTASPGILRSSLCDRRTALPSTSLQGIGLNDDPNPVNQVRV